MRGKVIPVIDLRKKFEMDVEEWTKNTRIIVCDVDGTVIGMIVDAVEEVLRIPSSTIEPAPEIVTTVNSDYIKGVAKLEGSYLDYRMAVGKVKVDQIVATGADYVAAPCANSRPMRAAAKSRILSIARLSA